MATGDYYTSTAGNTAATWTTWTTTSATDRTTNGTWYQWNDGSYSNPAYIVQPALTPEQIQKEEIERKRQEENRRIAEERALQLLLDNLDENQKAIYGKTTTIPIKGKSGGLYRINKGRAGNVEQVDEKGIRLKKLCFHPTLDLPDYDVMLAQKLMLECCEEEARKIANFS